MIWVDSHFESLACWKINVLALVKLTNFIHFFQNIWSYSVILSHEAVGMLINKTADSGVMKPLG